MTMTNQARATTTTTHQIVTTLPYTMCDTNACLVPVYTMPAYRKSYEILKANCPSSKMIWTDALYLVTVILISFHCARRCAC